MKFLFLLFITIVFSLFETVVYPIPVLLYICIGCMVVSRERVFVYAFFAGLLLDFIAVRPIGMDSAFFLISVSFLYLYRRRIHPHAPYYLLPYTLLVTALYGYINVGRFSPGWFFTSVIFSVGTYFSIFFLFRKFFPRDSLSI